MLHAVLAGHQNFGGLRAAKRSVAVFENSCLHLFAWQRVRHKNHTTFVACNKDATVGNLFDVESKFAA
jgi:hypothetical protein